MAERVYPRSYSVEQVIFYIKDYLGEDKFLSSIAVSGEVRELRVHSSGHVYLTLQEKEFQLKSVLFRRYAALQQWMPQVGDQVIVIGSVSVYERDGSVQLYAQAILPAGEGDARRSQDALKRRLEEEGFFAPERKKSLPIWAEKVGVITGENSAAWADMQRILRQRFPGVALRLYPALVQGDQAPASLAAAIEKADQGGHDVLLLGRGGGADADLSAFNTEIVVRAIAAAKTPLISAVGHESDISLADLAADVRAATPTHGATLAVPDAGEIREGLDRREQRLRKAFAARLKQAEARLTRLESAACFREPLSLLGQRELGLQALQERLAASAENKLARQGEALHRLALRLELLSPLATLSRGYSLALNEKGQPLRQADQCRVGEKIHIQLAKGSLKAEVLDVQPGTEREERGAGADGKGEEKL